MKRDAPDCESKPSCSKAPREWTVGSDGYEEDDFDWWQDEQEAPIRPWDSMPPIACLPDGAIPPNHADLVRRAERWVSMDDDRIRELASRPSYSMVCAVLSEWRGRPDASDAAAAAIDAVVERDPGFVKCNDIVFDDGWAFSTALWPEKTAFLVAACGPDRVFGWFSVAS